MSKISNYTSYGTKICFFFWMVGALSVRYCNIHLVLGNISKFSYIVLNACIREHLRHLLHRRRRIIPCRTYVYKIYLYLSASRFVKADPPATIPAFLRQFIRTKILHPCEAEEVHEQGKKSPGASFLCCFVHYISHTHP